MRAFFEFCALAMVFHLGGIATGQVSANALHNRYPAPTMEDMEVRPGISLTVWYGTGLIACEMRIHPTSASLLVTEREPMMVPETVTEIMREVIPESERGKAGMALKTFAGCNTMSRQEYEFVDITRSSHECLPLQAARENPAVLTFKWPECVAPPKPKSQPDGSAATQAAP